MNLIVHHLRFTLEASTLVHLGPQAGAQIRGALWAALREFACAAPSLAGDPAHSQVCPMCRLVALETANDPRGTTPPRPFAIRPPLTARAIDDRVFYPGDRFEVGVNLFGDVASLFPYVCQAFDRMGQIGVGYGRGRFVLETVQAVDPLTGETMDLLHGRRLVSTPGLPVTADSVARAAERLPVDGVTLRFLTPLHLTHGGKQVDRLTFPALIARLLERCQAIEQHYTPNPTPQPVWRERYLALTRLAEQVRVVEGEMRWATMRSGSRRTDSSNSIGGLVGRARFEGDLAPFREWLLWGQSLHVGKNAVKGNGWYAIGPDDAG